MEGFLALRRRSSWEAADTGLLLWRENFLYFLPFFALPFWICAFALRLLPGNLPRWSWLVVWLFKPFFDRLVLHVVSTRFFAGSTDMARLFHGLAATLRRGIVGDLFWRRFSPIRAAMMPVRTLENIPRQRIAERRRALKKGGLDFCFLLTVWGLALEPVLLCGEVLFFAIIMKIIHVDFIFSFGEFIVNGEIFLFAVSCFNFILTESLYVCMGFGIYLNSRVVVEGWDIELLFRGFAGKDKKKNILSIIIVFCVIGLFAPEKGFAEDGEREKAVNTIDSNSTDEPPLETLRAVLDSADFGGWREGWGIRWKNKRPEQQMDVGIAPWVKIIRQVFAYVLRFVLAALIAALGVFLFIYLGKLNRSRERPGIDFSIQVLGEKTVEATGSLIKKARCFFDKGDLRLAWGFCIAALIRSWSLYRGLQFPPNATEYDCMELVRSAEVSPDAENFTAALSYWVNFAYGGRIPPGGSFETAIAFCESLKPEAAHG
jgi:hypothetical protein